MYLSLKCHLLKHQKAYVKKWNLDQIIIILDDNIFESVKNSNYKNELNMETLKTDGPRILPQGSYHFWDF